MPRNKANILVVPVQPILNDQLVRAPASDGVNIPGNPVAVNFTVNLSTADKEAVGKTLTLKIFLLAGDEFAASIDWVSYGRQLTVRGPDGADIINPDPSVMVNVGNLKNQRPFITYLAHGIATAGLTISTLT
jgi:hypothetical protein